MKKIKDLDENFAIAHFLKGELDNDIEGKKLRAHIQSDGISLSIIENPNLIDDGENKIRKRILHYRGYPNSFLFKGFPDDIEWALYEINNEDLDNIMFINNDPFWKEMTNNTRLIKNSLVDKPNDSRHKKIIEILEEIKNDRKLPEMILVRDEDSIIMFEGHHRAAAFAIASKNKKIKINAIIGNSRNLKGWYYY